MRSLVILIAISILSFTFTFTSTAQITSISTEGTYVPNVWKKFKGETVPAGVPEIVDWSYAGYKNGNEPIPDGSGLPVYRLADYGGIANDDLSDTQAIKDTIAAARGGGIVLFTKGRYDIFMEDDNKDCFIITGSNIILKGAGGAGADRGGTSLKMHHHVNGNNILDNHIFHVSWKGNGREHSGGAGITRIVGEFPKGVKRFEVANGSALSGRKYFEIYGSGLTGEDWDKHSSKSQSQLPDASEVKTAGISIFEIHEIDSLDGNWVTIKAPTLTHLNSNFEVYWRDLTEGIGFEDLHIEGTLDHDYEHLQHRGSGGMILKYTAHCWVKRCRFSNVIDSIWFANSYANTALANIIDGNGGHNSLTVTSSAYCLFGLYEDRTRDGVWHGITSTSAASGSVFYRIGGPAFGGPDTHGSQPRDTLLDNLYGRYHDDSGGTPESKPSHLDGFVRWNNKSRQNSTYDLWQPDNKWGLMVTEAIIIGWVAPNASIRDAYTESIGTHVYPESLYEAQGLRRLGTLPAMITEGIEDFKYLFNTLYNTRVGVLQKPAHIYYPITPVRNRTSQVRDAIMLFYPTKQDYDEVRHDNLAELHTLDLSGRGITALKSGDFDGLTTLRYLILNDNELTTLPNDIFDELGSVIHLYLENNNFRIIPKLAFRSLGSMTALYLNDNELITLSETQFAASSVLTHIDLNNNKIKTIHNNAFAGLPRLGSLYLSGNKLEELPRNVFTHTPKLGYLSISDNELTELPAGIFEGLKSLSRLDVSGNTTDPLPVTIAPTKSDEGRFNVYIPVGASFNIDLQISVENGSANKKQVTIKTGETRSETLQVARSDGTTDAVTVTVGELPSLPQHHAGYIFVRGADWPLTIIDAIGAAPAAPRKSALLPNFPNPFNPETWIPYQLAKPANVSITIFNSRGVVVRELVFGMKAAGYYTGKSSAAHWDGRNNSGERVSSGMYFYQFKTDSMSVLKKMVIMK